MKNFHKIAIACSLATLAVPTSFVGAQESGANSLEEIVVTGRKRDESLIDVPVSISVWGATALEDAGIFTQQDLFDATVGLNFDTASTQGDRNASNPSVRGVQSNEIATTQQKVNSFIDGTPLLGQIGSLTFSGVDQVEVYRGPQSAAFGRATFAGAINYISTDASDEFEGEISGRVSDLGSNELGVVLSGPINDKLGYRISYVADEFEGPDEWTATDGTKMGTEETDTLSAKLNFQISDTVYGEITYTNLDQLDGPSAQWDLDPANCSGDSGIIIRAMGGDTELFNDAFDCDIYADSMNPIRRNHDALGQFRAFYEANPSALGGLTIDQFLAQTLPDGQTFEQQLLANTYTPFVKTERDRLHGELNFEVGDGLLKFLGMYSEEYYQRWSDSDGSDTVGVFVVNMMSGLADLDMNLFNMSDPTDIEETYLEARWVSPDNQRLRYTVSASYYDYDFLTEVFNDYGAIEYGLTLPDGTPVDADRNNIISESAQNYGAAFGLTYDLTETTTLSFEGRFQNDENCGTDVENNLEECVSTSSFAPRLAVNHSLGDNSSMYAQISQGTNPAGVNIFYHIPGAVEAIEIANGTRADSDGIVYDGSDGIHFPAAFFTPEFYQEFEEETLTNFEIGYKGSFLDGRANLTTSVYYMTWEDLVQADNVGWDDQDTNGWNSDRSSDFTAVRTFYNQGDAELYGIEFEGDFQVNDIFTVAGNISFGSNTYDDYCSVNATDLSGNVPFDILLPGVDGVEVACAIVDGNDLPRATSVKGALQLSANLPNDIFGMRTSLRADVRHTGKTFADDLNLIERNPVTLVNLSANMRSDNLTLRFYVNNVFDEDEPRNANPGARYTDNPVPGGAAIRTGAWVVTPSRPREIGLSFGYEF